MQLQHEIVWTHVWFLRVAKHVRSWSKVVYRPPLKGQKGLLLLPFLPAPLNVLLCSIQCPPVYLLGGYSAFGVLQSRKMRMMFTASPCVHASALGAVLRAPVCAASSL